MRYLSINFRAPLVFAIPRSSRDRTNQGKTPMRFMMLMIPGGSAGPVVITAIRSFTRLGLPQVCCTFCGRWAVSRRDLARHRQPGPAALGHRGGWRHVHRPVASACRCAGATPDLLGKRNCGCLQWRGCARCRTDLGLKIRFLPNATNASGVTEWLDYHQHAAGYRRGEFNRRDFPCTLRPKSSTTRGRPHQSWRR